MVDVSIRPAVPGDAAAIHALIRELAEYERLTQLCTGSTADLADALFGPRPAAEVLLAEVDGGIAGFALFFHNFSTFLARRGLWLEDLYVRPAFRGHGVGSGLLRAVAAIAVNRRCGRFEWSVLDWNAPAIGFYERLGATVMPDWRIARVTGDALAHLGRPASD
ncbi:MAG: GNAT family N-acetyltransferase [Betaproteobacteria bacterium]|nr:GNAT family N-acetyltransferase [Betaproteobacteria bacterium]